MSAPTKDRAVIDVTRLEAKTIHVLREVAGGLNRPALLFSGGRGSAVLMHPAVRAFTLPLPPPFTLLHVDTGHNDPEELKAGNLTERGANRADDRISEATVCWLTEEPLRPGVRVPLKHCTRTTSCRVPSLPARFDEQGPDFEHDPRELELNQIGRSRSLAAGIVGDTLSAVAGGNGSA